MPMQPVNRRSGKPVKVRKYKQETPYAHKRSDGLTTKRKNGGTNALTGWAPDARDHG